MPRAVSERTLERRRKREERRKLREKGLLPPLNRKPRGSVDSRRAKRLGTELPKKLREGPKVLKELFGTTIKAKGRQEEEEEDTEARYYVAADPAERGKRRRKGLAILVQASHPPNQTPDGSSWLGVDGTPPKLDGNGKLTEPFVLAFYDSNGKLMKTERFGVGVKLPRILGEPRETKEEESETGEEAEVPSRRKKVRMEKAVKERVLAKGGTNGKTGRRWKDEGLTPEQLAKREKRRQRRLARQARR